MEQMYVSLEAINAIENFMNAEVSFDTEESCLAAGSLYRELLEEECVEDDQEAVYLLNQYFDNLGSSGLSKDKRDIVLKGFLD